jgi:hypothetical protein
MGKPSQAILVAGKKNKKKVMSGEKLITIREGERDYTLGKVLIGCPYTNWMVEGNITSVKHLLLKDVPIEDISEDGFKDHQEALDVLQTYYPQLTLDSTVTVLRWELIHSRLIERYVKDALEEWDECGLETLFPSLDTFLMYRLGHNYNNCKHYIEK